jgi:hypothetical protein
MGLTSGKPQLTAAMDGNAPDSSEILLLISFYFKYVPYNLCLIWGWSLVIGHWSLVIWGLPLATSPLPLLPLTITRSLLARFVSD